MSRIYKRDTRVSIKIDDLVIEVSPLSLDQKSEVSTLMLHGRNACDLKELNKAISLAIKYAVKSVKGLTDENDDPYNVSFDGDSLSDQCVEELMNIEESEKMVMVCTALINKIPKMFTDMRGKAIEGVELISKGVASKNS